MRLTLYMQDIYFICPRNSQNVEDPHGLYNFRDADVFTIFINQLTLSYYSFQIISLEKYPLEYKNHNASKYFI